MSSIDEALLSTILIEAGRKPRVEATEAISGGNINQAWRIQLPDGEQLFLKLNHARHAAMFEGEAEGLMALGETGAVRVPWPLGQGLSGDRAWLLCEHLPLQSAGENADARLGECLAQLHSHTADAYGWHRDNHIGLTLQRNRWTTDWITFFRDQRLGPQLDQLSRKEGLNAMVEKGRALMESLPGLLPDCHPAPSLLHGDLWFGNRACSPDGEAVLFDPASHFGDSDCDLAMTELFGGFSSRFYQAYRHHHPRKEDYPLRRDLYQLYHTLNHANLFGGIYAAQATRLIEGLLSEAAKVR
ncbi:fructosamine-3-kinase [Natronospira proteinivora]|uniref:Fructosamine-3-kinase n=1 Tax=Natronospira proteinivora TaxID=1807133 RepID=A0ABT1GD23_9GAMM|nr:fructosamine kinase family protein [Natronospira proteinivora]MCP1728168.1 fructosamine-3-kinase [Natronospira proteinivora]